MNLLSGRATTSNRLRLQVAVSLQLIASTSIAAIGDDGANDNANDHGGLTPYAAFDIGYDNNVLRLPNVAAAQAIGAGSSLSDSWHRLGAGISLDEKLSQQEYLLQAEATKIDFDRLQQLDHYDKSGSFDWKWHTAGKLDGNLGVTYVQDVAPYIDFHLLEANLRTQESEYADAAWLFNPSWRLRGGLTSFHVNYDIASQQVANRTEDRSELGIEFLPSSGSDVGLQLRHISAYFPVAQQVGLTTITNNYVQNEVKAKIDWTFSAITQMHFLGGWVQRQYDAFSERNFSGPNMRFSVDWLPTRLLSFKGDVWREIDSVDDLTAAFSLNRGVGALAKWSISERLKAEGEYKYERQDFSQSAAIGTAPFLNDAIRSATLLLTYNPTSRLRLRATVARMVQTQTNPSSGFSSNGATLGCRYEF